MKISNLTFAGIVHVPALKNADLSARYETHAIGGGEWSIEVYGPNGEFLKEFVGSNGTRPGEEATDLWVEVSEWEQEVARPAHSYKNYTAPDGATGSISFFRREVERGRLHGCVIIF